MRRRITTTAAVGALLLCVTACSSDGADAPATTTPAPIITGTWAGPALHDAKVTGDVATGLEVPWGLAVLPDGSALVAERESGRVLHLSSTDPGATVTEAGTVPGVVASGEGGLLGLAVPRGDSVSEVFAYYSSASDNRVVSMPWNGETLGSPTYLLDGIPKAGNHNGGRIVVGPDGKLWIGTGDGGERSNAQNRESLGGKILRIETTGEIPADNPFADSPVYSLGHRNVQGIAFSSDGTPYATEFGQDREDELNLIRPGRNYGWPEVEGFGGSQYANPVVTWTTDEASPSGLAIVDDVAYVAGLRGQRLWEVRLDTLEKRAVFEGEYGRLRTVEPAPGGGLLLTTSNRDGRGSPKDGDDRVMRVALS